MIGLRRTRILVFGTLLSALALGVQLSPALAANPAPPKAAAPPADSLAVPVAEVATRAAEVPNLLRILTEPLAPNTELEAIRRHLSVLRERTDLELAAATMILRGEPTLDAIQSQQQLLHERQVAANQWLAMLTNRATALQTALSRLAGIKKTWRETRDASVASTAPAAIIEQIDGVLAAIEATETPLVARRTAVLDLQSFVAQDVTRIDTMQAQFTEAQQSALEGLLRRDSPPLWATSEWAESRRSLGPRVREIAAARRDEAVQYLLHPARGLLLHVVAFVALAAMLHVARRQVHRTARDGEAPAITAFERPYSAALIVILFLASSPNSGVPPSVRSLFEVLTLVPAIRLTRPAIDARLAPAVYTLAILFALNSLRQVVGNLPLVGQAFLTLEMLAGIAVLGHMLTRGTLRHPALDGAHAERLHAFRVGAVLLMLGFGAVLLAGVAGHMRLARLLASGLLGSGALALALYACIQVATGVVAFLLCVWPLRLLQMVAHHRDLLERRARWVLVWMAIAGWAVRSLDYVGIFQPAKDFGRTLLALPLGRGSISFTVGDVLEFVVTLLLAYFVSALVRFVLQEDVYPRTRMTRGISYAVSSLLNYVILALGFLLALGALGMDLNKVTILAGAFGVGIGFGLQSVVNNFVSGLILLFERPIHVGDVVEIGNLVGEVSRIGMRASTVRTYRGAEIIVPNAQLVTERVTNWTLSDRRRRIDLPVGVDYGSAPEKVMKVLEDVARGHPQVLKDPPPQAVFIAFGDSSINFELRAWTSWFERWVTIQTELAVGVYAALHDAGMTMPFPQREVRVLQDPPGGLASLPRPPGRAAGGAG